MNGSTAVQLGRSAGGNRAGGAPSAIDFGVRLPRQSGKRLVLQGMSTELANDRTYALVLAKRFFYDRSVTVEAILDTFAETSDPLITRLLDLIVHEPARTGAFITVSQRDYERNYWPAVADVLQQLERGEAGVVPRIRPWSWTRIFWIAVLGIFAAASSAEHAMKFIQHASGEVPLGAWAASACLGGALLMGFLAVATGVNLMAAIRHRLRRDA